VVELLQEERGEVRRTRVVDVRTGFEETWPDWDEERLLNVLVTRAGLRL
jgi:hypothetical protein